jgi:hypothetical protein
VFIRLNEFWLGILDPGILLLGILGIRDREYECYDEILDEDNLGSDCAIILSFWKYSKIMFFLFNWPFLF